jgi:prepilin-type N-terminal cleavage/methylation domain-containing protein
MGTGYRGLVQPRRRMGRGGFSLIEMLLVVVVLAILARLALPRLDYGRYRVNTDARALEMTLAYAQRLAVSLQHNVLVSFNTSTAQVITTEDKNDDGVYTPGERVRGFSLSTGVIFARVGAPDLPAPNPTNEITSVTFLRDGSATTAGVVFLSTARAASNNSTEDTRAITVTRATGRPSWFTYTGGSWRQGS